MIHQTASTYEELESNFVNWAKAQANILAAIVIGSRAQLNHLADEWSDLDLILFTTTPAAYAPTTEWLKEIGEVWVPVLNYTGRGDPEWLVLFADGLKVDFILAAVTDPTANLAQMMGASPYQFVFWRGVRVLLDKSDSQGRIDLSVYQGARPARPAPGEFLAKVNQALLSATRASKFLKRGELWRAKHQCDCDLKQHLLTMLEWHARAVNGLEHDTWYDGRFLEEWAGPRALEALAGTFAAYNTDDLWRALFASLELFRDLAMETAERLGYSYPALADSQVTEWIRRVYSPTLPFATNSDTVRL